MPLRKLTDAHLYGLDEKTFDSLCRMSGVESIGIGKDSLIIKNIDCEEERDGKAHATGAYQEAIPVRLYIDGVQLAGHFILKIPKRAMPPNQDPTRAEGEKAGVLQGLENIVPLPLGYAWCKRNEDSNAEKNILCILQGKIKGETLQEKFYVGNGVVNSQQLWEFLKERDDGTFWSAADSWEHIPFVLVMKHILLPIASVLEKFEYLNWQHNDISPSNIIWDVSDARFKLVDFANTSKIGAELLGAGTPPYAPPEVKNREGRKVAATGTDIRALCAICWQLLGYPLTNDANGNVKTRQERLNEIERASVPQPLGNDFIARVIKRILDESNSEETPDNRTIKRLSDSIQMAEEDWLDDLKAIILGKEIEGRLKPISAKDVHDHFGEAVAKLNEDVERIVNQSDPRPKYIALAIILVVVFVAVARAIPFISRYGLFILEVAHSPAFYLISFAIAVSTIIAGCCVDSPIAWLHFKRSYPNEALSLKKFQLVAKYGDLKQVKAGIGRYDPTWHYILYAGGCNALGALCYLTLLHSCSHLEGFYDFIATHPSLLYITEIVAPVIAAFVAWMTTVHKQKMPTMTVQRKDRENPDTNSFLRFHVWANMLHLTWTFAWVIVLVVALIYYCFAEWRIHDASPWLIIPMLCVALFILFSGVSKYAQGIAADALGSVRPILFCLVALSGFFGYVAFVPSISSFLYLIVGISALTLFVYTPRHLDAIANSGSRDEREWVRKWRKSSEKNIIPSAIILIAIFAVVLLSLAFEKM